MKTDFMIIGAMKSGTTTLARVLAQHPKVSFASRKEPDFFSTSKNWRAELESYERLFDPDPRMLRGEGSTSYTFYPHRNLGIWNDIYDYNPAMRFIYIVRNPLERVVSQYTHLYERGYFQDSLEEAILNRPIMLDYSRYHTQVRPFIECFGRERVLLLDFDDLKARPEALFRRVADFLDLEPGPLIEAENTRANAHEGGKGRVHHRIDEMVRRRPAALTRVWRLLPGDFRRGLFDRMTLRRHNALPCKPELSPAMREVVTRLLEPETSAMERLLGKPLPSWRGASGGVASPDTAETA